MKPRIGLTSAYNEFEHYKRINIVDAYVDAVAAAGGLPIGLPSLADGASPEELLDVCDGLLVVGGPDIDPALWGEERHPNAKVMDPRRQRTDLALIAEADRRRLPTLGTCLGSQELAVARGGRLFQHIPDQFGEAVLHTSAGQVKSLHYVTIEPGSLLASIVGPEPLETNSSHHQAIRDPGRGMRVVARSEDSVIEAIEDPEPGRFFLAVQWHPEMIYDRPRHLALFQALCRAAAQQRKR